MRFDAGELPAGVATFLTERHLATLSTLRRNGTPHVVAVGFTWDPSTRLARVITAATSQKAVNVAAGGAAARAVVCQLDGPRWLAMEGVAEVTDDPDRVAEAVRRYSGRYREPRPNPSRVAIEITVDRVLGAASLVPGAD